MSPRLLIHIGYHKTATTWMQRNLFLPAHGFCQIADHAEVFRHIVQPHGLHFDHANITELINQRLKDVEKDVVPVISSEILCGHPFYGGRESDTYAQRLAWIAPDARILISIREQKRILPSVYMQYLSRGGTVPCNRFFSGTDEPGYFGFTPRHFEYDLLVAHYQRLFGTRNVHVLTQESLQTDMDGAAAAVAAFAKAGLYSGLVDKAREITAASYPEFSAPVLRRINHVQASILNPTPVIRLGTTPNGLYRIAGYFLRRPPLTTLLRNRKPVSAHVARRFAGYYRDSNARLAALVDHPLDLSGYD